MQLALKLSFYMTLKYLLSILLFIKLLYVKKQNFQVHYKLFLIIIIMIFRIGL